MTKLNPPTDKERRELMENYATLRYFGDSAKEASGKVGVAHSTALSWEAQEWWRVIIVDRVERLHVSKLISKARRVVGNVIEAGLHPEATSKDRTLAFKASQWMLERQDAQFADRTETSKQLAGKNLAELSVAELRALARSAEIQHTSSAPLPPELPEIEVLPATKEPPAYKPGPLAVAASRVPDLSRADKAFENS